MIPYLIGWLGVALGLLVPIPQFYKILRTKKTGDVSVGTYTLLVMAITCYLIHAISIGSIVFTVSQSINLITNTIVLICIIKGKK